MKRPGFPTNVAGQAQLLRGDQKFFSIAADSSELLRFLPAPREDGFIFYPVTNHYGIVNQDKKKMALACLIKHGNADTGKACLLCAINQYFQDNAEALGFDDEAANRLRPSTRFYAQVLRASIKDSKVAGWSHPMLIQFSATAAGDIQTIFDSQSKFGQPIATDPDQGQGIIVTRTGNGYKTKYKAERTGEIVSLDVIRPTWGDEFMSDLYKEIGLNVATPAQQLSYLRVTFPALDLDSIVAELGFEELLAEK
jgi:hypothetical protein